MAEYRHMGPLEIMWTITGVMVPLLLGTAWAMIGLSPPEFWIARGSVLAAALIFTASAIVWISNIQWPTGSRFIIAAALGLAAIIGFSECLRWINSREAIFIAQQRSASDKRANIRAKLQQFYVASTPLLNRDLPKDISEADFQKYETEVNTWANTTAQWIQQNLGDAAVTKFADIGSGFSFNWNRAINEKHNNIINYLTRFRQNLSILIESGAWDAVKVPSADTHKATPHPHT